jgi:hypothetical protein
MHGGQGDWQVIDDDGDIRTITNPEFLASHEHLAGDTWRRSGILRAWQVTERILIRTKEGNATARPGDWIVQGPAGERWPVRDDQFRRSYRPAVEPTVPVQADHSSAPDAASSSTEPVTSG